MDIAAEHELHLELTEARMQSRSQVVALLVMKLNRPKSSRVCLLPYYRSFAETQYPQNLMDPVLACRPSVIDTEETSERERVAWRILPLFHDIREEHPLAI